MAENVATQLTDESITHTVNLLRFSVGLRRKVFSNLEQMEKELVAALAQIDPTGVTRSRYRQARLEELLRQTRAILKTNYSEIRNTQIAELGRMAALEQVHAARVLNSSIGIELFRPVITEASLKAMASDTILTMGASSADTVRGWWEQQAGAFERRYAATVRQGMYRDEAMGQLVRRVRDLGVPTRRGAEALVRTSVLGVANQVNEQIIRSRPDVVNGVAIVVTLDLKTSLQCLSLSGSAWRLDTGEPLPGSASKIPYPGRPPYHFNALPGDMRIQTSEGLCPISRIRVGQLVLTHAGRYKPVYTVMRKHVVRNFLRVFYFDTGRILLATKEHPILTLSRGWQQAGGLQAGDQCFYDTRQTMEVLPVPPMEPIPDNQPAMVEQEFIPDDVHGSPVLRFMRFPVNFEGNTGGEEGKVNTIVDEGVLEYARDAVLQEERQEELLYTSRVFPQVQSPSHHSLGNDILASHGVVEQHAQRRNRVFFPIATMLRSPGYTGSPFGSFCAGLERFYAAPDRYFELLEPVIQRGGFDVKLPLDFSYGQPLFPMFGSDDFPQFFLNLHEATLSSRFGISTIVSIAEKEFNGDVWNIAVEDDETYVAEGIVTHNCRSTMIAVIKSYSELGKSLTGRTRYKAALERLDDEQAKRLDGKLPIGQNYASWLAKQPAAVQRHVLGAKRLELWKEGKIGLVDLIDQRARALTIEELERL